LELLRRAWAILEKGGVLLVCEGVLADDPTKRHPTSAVWMMYLALIGGKQRTFSQFRRLLAEAGFEDVQETPVLRTQSLITAKKP
ncbi:MAG: methyltransferase, partial [Planctomycetota bacterium]